MGFNRRQRRSCPVPRGVPVALRPSMAASDVVVPSVWDHASSTPGKRYESIAAEVMDALGLRSDDLTRCLTCSYTLLVGSSSNAHLRTWMRGQDAPCETGMHLERIPPPSTADLACAQPASMADGTGILIALQL